jgi:hypothetical protein
MMRKKSGFMPVRGSSSVAAGGYSSVELFISDTTVFVSLVSFTRTAEGLEGAVRAISAFLSGLGVTNSLRAPAPSMIVEPDIPIAAWTVRVYELHSSSSFDRDTSTDSGSFFTGRRSPIETALLSDCFDILSTILVISIPSEKLIRKVALSITFTLFTVSSVGVSAA